MADPTLTDQQRHLLRTFRAIVTERQEAEARAAARFEAEQQAAGAAFDQASQTAEARLSAVHQAQGEAQALLARADLQSLGSQAPAQPPSAGSGDDPAQKLALHAARAKEVAAALPGLVEALQSARKNARRRQLILAAVGVVGLIAVVIFVAGALEDLQEQRALRQAQTTATAQAIAAQETATAVVPVLARLEDQTGMQMVYVPPGDFMMGSSKDQGYNDERPQHAANLSAYWIDKTEVTAAQYQRCVEAGACSAPGAGDYCTFGVAGRENHPINCVDWNQAAAYCSWAGKRLPTEAEWEKAARGTDGRVYPWGDTWDASKLNSAEGGPGTTTAVGTYPAGASPYGALDMAGNVWEWIADWYDPIYYAQSPRQNPTGPASKDSRIMRGGSWNNFASFARVAVRYPVAPDLQTTHRGFRCTRSP